MIRKSRSHSLTADRYRFDCGECSSANGFCQIDTRQDASYFGVWTNPQARKIVSYAEGDITRVECDTDAEYAAELRALLTCYDSPSQQAMIDVSFNIEAQWLLDTMGLTSRTHGRAAA